jgi:uncharacterized protein YecE (DUF72 family)
MKKLKDPENAARKFFASVSHLKRKLGPVLFQLPPRWHADADRLSDFLHALPKGMRYVFEFRDKSWYSEKVFESLRNHRAALCIHDHRESASPMLVTADFAYVRLHGTAASYRGCYTEAQLAGWAERIARWNGAGVNVFCYFNNDAEGHAVRNALRLRELLEPLATNDVPPDRTE